MRAHDMDALRKLTDIVFRPGMPEQYPQLFNTDNLDNLRVCFDKRVCVSHVGMVQRNALLMGCRIRVCCIGAVATHPDYRNKGLASACFDSAVQKAHSDGVDVMIVSGGRGLYIRNGCLNLGRDYRVNADQDALSRVDIGNVDVISMLDGNPELVKECYRREPVRFVRPPADYDYFLQSGWAMNSPAEILMIHEQTGAGQKRGAFLGYIVLRKQEPGKSTTLIEYGGDRHAVLAALPQVLSKYGLTGVSFQVMGSDKVMQSLCEREAFEMTPTSASGTIKLINFPQLMTRMRPRFDEIVGPATANRLRFEQDGDHYIFALSDETLTLDRNTATRAVFGDLDGLPQELNIGLHELGSQLRAILPLPTLWYGINYV